MEDFITTVGRKNDIAEGLWYVWVSLLLSKEVQWYPGAEIKHEKLSEGNLSLQSKVQMLWPDGLKYDFW